VLATAVDVVRIVFFAATCVLTVQMMLRMGSYSMTIIDAPMNIVYGVCLAGFAAMLVRSVLLAVTHWRRGWTVLERPGLDDPVVE
jgi:TRAP-type C4-dicarboxylate transport system permease small subunit